MYEIECICSEDGRLCSEDCCSRVWTDCCNKRRAACVTTVVLDPARDPTVRWSVFDVVVCRIGLGCETR